MGLKKLNFFIYDHIIDKLNDTLKRYHPMEIAK